MPRVSRAALLEALQEMPDEAFGWFISWTQHGYPDGLGGFKPDSRAAIEHLRRAGQQYSIEFGKREHDGR